MPRIDSRVEPDLGPSTLSHDALAKLLRDVMPNDSVFHELRDWNCDFLAVLGPEWIDAAVYGSRGDVDCCAGQLGRLFLETCPYGEFWSELREPMHDPSNSLRSQAERLIVAWRAAVAGHAVRIR